jgi:hypothetical protein
MLDERALRRRAQTQLKRGALPRRAPQAIHTRTATDHVCGVCGEPIGSGDIEWELSFALPRRPEPMIVRLHAPCLAAWEVERSRRAKAND